MEPHRKTFGFCKAGSRKRFRLVFYRREIPHPTATRCPSRAAPQPIRLRSVARTARTRPALRRKAISTAMPAAPAVYAPRLGPASSACVLLPAQVSRLRRLPFAAVAHSGCAVCPSQRCAYTASALGMACRKVDVRRPGRVLAAARTPLRRLGCYVFLHVRGWLWGAGSARVPH